MLSLGNDSEKRTKKPITSWRHWQKWKCGLGCCICVQQWSLIRQTRTLYGIMKVAVTFYLPPCNKRDSPSSHECFNSTTQRRAKSDGTMISLLPFVNFSRESTTIFWNCKNRLHIWQLMKLSIPTVDESASTSKIQVILPNTDYSSEFCVIQLPNSPMYHFHMLGSQQVRQTSTT